jgi:hypothetical protein
MRGKKIFNCVLQPKPSWVQGLKSSFAVQTHPGLQPPLHSPRKPPRHLDPSGKNSYAARPQLPQSAVIRTRSGSKCLSKKSNHTLFLFASSLGLTGTARVALHVYYGILM